MSFYPVVAKYSPRPKAAHHGTTDRTPAGIVAGRRRGLRQSSRSSRSAREIYGTQKLHLRKLVERSICRPIGSNTTDEAGQIAPMLHDFAGTAAYFGETAFGATARRLERVVASALTACLLTPLCAEILAGLGPRFKR